MIPEEIGDIQSLVELDLSDNKLFSLPDSVGNLGRTL
jgi:Leucine-rich repeat (LRR) protein